jgi:hypothetical protein
MTSQVMAGMTSRPQIRTMKKLLPAIVLIPFTAYSVLVIEGHGYLGFLTLAAREPWGMQMLLDLCISLFLVGAWIRHDARARGIPALPYLLALPFVGSIGALAYLVHRALKATPAQLPAAAS